MARAWRRRSVLVAVVTSAAWLGCNALLGIEGAEHAPDDDGGALGDGSSGGDGGRDGDEGARDARVDADETDACIDLLSNPRHCGACGRDCIGGACVGGTCQPVVVSAEEGRPSAVTSDGTYVYWTNPSLGDVRRATVDGGAVEIVYDGPPGTPFGLRLARGGSTVYFSVADDLDGGVFACPVTGCPAPASVLSGLATPTYFDVTDGGTLVVAENVFAGRVLRCTLPCTTGAEVVAPDERFPTFVTASESAVLWDTLIPVLGNIRIARGAAAAETLHANRPTREIHVSGDAVLFAEQGAGVWSTSLDGGTPRRLYAPGAQTEHLAVDGTDVFFTDTGPSGRILRCGLGGCGDAGVVVAREQPYPLDVAVDGTQVFWSDQGPADAGGGVFRARK